MGFNPNPTIKPPFGSYIDWDNPISKNLIVEFLLNEDIGSFVNNGCWNKYPGNGIDLSWGSNGAIFNGTSSEIQILNTAPLTFTNFTIEVIFTVNAWGNYNHIIAKQGGAGNNTFTIEQNSTYSYLHAGCYSTAWTFINTPVLNLNQLYHLFMSYNGSVIELTLDNNLIGSVAFTNIGTSTSNINIGCYDDGSLKSNFWNGSINLVRIWQRTLSDNEKEQLYYEPYCFISWPINRRHFYITTTAIVNLILSSIQESQQIKSLGLTQDQNISLNNILNNEQLSSILLQQIYNLFTSNIDENQILQNILLSQIQNVNVSTLQENQSLSSISVTTGIVLALTAIAQNQNISLIKLLQIQNIITELLEQDQNVSLATITQIQNVLSQAISQNQDISSVAVNTAIVLALSALLQSQQLEQITITQDQNILLDALNQQEQLTQLLLTQIQNIKTSNIDENQSISSVALNLALVLVLSAINQNQNLSSALISQIQTIFVDAINQINDVKDLTVSQLLDIVIQNILQDNVLSDVFLKQYEAIPEPIKTLVAEFFDFIIKFKP